MMPILRVRDDEGNYVNIPAIKGEPGASGVIDGTTETTVSGILKGTGGHIAAAAAGTDYATPEQVNAKQNTITASGILKGNGSGGISAAAAGTDYIQPESGAWTPTAVGGIITNVSSNDARYYKCGDLVYIYFNGQFDAVSSPAYAEIGGLPFVPTYHNGVGTVHSCDRPFNIHGHWYAPTVVVVNGNARIRFCILTETGGITHASGGLDYQGTYTMAFSLCYYIGE